MGSRCSIKCVFYVWLKPVSTSITSFLLLPPLNTFSTISLKMIDENFLPRKMTQNQNELHQKRIPLYLLYPTQPTSKAIHHLQPIKDFQGAFHYPLIWRKRGLFGIDILTDEKRHRRQKKWFEKSVMVSSIVSTHKTLKFEHVSR